jgi:hypothetical protein
MNELFSEMIDELLKGGTIAQLIELPESVFNIAIERIRRKHLEGKGYRFQDPDSPAGRSTPEGG